MERRTTGELISILRNHDEQEWRPEAFTAAAAALVSRGVSPAEVEAMGPEGVDVVESAPTITLETLTSPSEAQLLRMALEEAGIEAWVTDETLGSMYGVGIGSRLQVRARDEAAAREVLSSTAVKAAPSPGEPACPACGSRNVAPASEARYVCSDCKETWPA